RSPGGGRPTSAARRPTTARRPPSRRQVRTHRLGAALAICGVAFGVGIFVGARHTSASETHARDFASAWSRGDYATMYSQLSPVERDRVSRLRFATLYQDALDTATATKLVTGKPREEGGAYRVPVHITTRAFGTIDGDVVVPSSDDGVDWSRALVF